MDVEVKTIDEKVREDIEALKGDVSRLSRDFARIPHHIGLRGRNMIMRNRERLRTMISGLEDRAKERVRDTSGVLKERSYNAVENWRGKVEHRPLTSLAVAFAAGAVIASFVEHKWR